LTFNCPQIQDGEYTNGIPVINFPRSKGGEGYTVPLNGTAFAALTELRKLSPDGTGIRKPSGLEIKACRKWLENACKKAGIVGVSAHVLRHTFARRLKRNRVALEDIKALLGHDLRKNKDRVTFGYAPAQLEMLRDAVATLVPKPFLVQKPPQTDSQTVTQTVTVANSETRHAATA
jgi:integrase